MARDDSSSRARPSRGSDSHFRAVPRDVPDFRFVGRQQDHPDREPGAEPVHDVARLAVRCGRVPAADGGRDRDDVRRASQGGRTTLKRGLAFYAIAAYAFLHVPLLILAVFSFNSSRFTMWQRFSLAWYREALGDRDLLESAANSLIIAVVAT